MPACVQHPDVPDPRAGRHADDAAGGCRGRRSCPRRGCRGRSGPRRRRSRRASSSWLPAVDLQVRVARPDAGVDDRDVDVHVAAVAADRRGRAEVGVRPDRSRSASSARTPRPWCPSGRNRRPAAPRRRRRSQGSSGSRTRRARRGKRGRSQPEARGDRSRVGALVEDDDVAVGGGGCARRHENGGAAERRQAKRESLHLSYPSEALMFARSASARAGPPPARIPCPAYP